MAYLDMQNPELYRQAVRSGFKLSYSVTALRGGLPVTNAMNLVPTGGSITDTTKPGVRRLLNLNLAPAPGLFDALAPIGTMLTVQAHVSYTNGVAEIPMGVFDVDSQKLSEGIGGLSLTAPDKWVKIQRAKFARPVASTPGILVVDQIASLIKGALGSDEAVFITASSRALTGSQVWEKDREKAINDLAASIGAWVYFDRLGYATVADLPTTTGQPDWLIDSSASGVLLDLDRQRSRTQTANVVVLESSSANDSPFPTVIVWDNDDRSPTYAGGDPINRPQDAGPFGVVVDFHNTPLPLDEEEARRAGLAILARVSGLASQVSLGQTPNPAVDAFDVLDVLPTRERYDIPRVLERHVADTLTHPLMVESPLLIDGRSTRTDEAA